MATTTDASAGRAVRLVTVHEAARYLSISRATLATMIKDGTIPSLKIGRSRRFDRTALDRWIEERIQTIR